DLILRQRHLHRAMHVVDFRHGRRRQQHFTAQEPSAGLDHQIADGPIAVVEKDFLDAADFPIGGENGQLRQLPDTPELFHVVLLLRNGLARAIMRLARPRTNCCTSGGTTASSSNLRKSSSPMVTQTATMMTERRSCRSGSPHDIAGWFR